MRALPASTLLEVWDDVRRRSAPARCLRLLAWSQPSQPLEALASYDLGLRDWYLLRWRCELFGHRIVGSGQCPHCSQAIEVELDARALLAEAPAAEAPRHVAEDGRQFRLPNSADMIGVADCIDVETAEGALLAACSIDGAPPANTRQSDAVARALGELAAERALQLQLQCAACGQSWTMGFDPGQFFWEELDACANALLDDVHLLASAYGWSEAQVLALSDARREAYLARVL